MVYRFFLSSKVRLSHLEHVQNHDKNESEQVWFKANRIRIKIESKTGENSSVWSFRQISDAQDVLRAPGATVAGASAGALSVLSNSQPDSWILVCAGFWTPGVSYGRRDEQ